MRDPEQPTSPPGMGEDAPEPTTAQRIEAAIQADHATMRDGTATLDEWDRVRDKALERIMREDAENE